MKLIIGKYEYKLANSRSKMITGQLSIWRYSI